MDIADKANDYMEAELERAIAAARGIPVSGEVKESSDECIECGELIPSERQIAVPGCDMCIDCQEKMERNNGLYKIARV